MARIETKIKSVAIIKNDKGEIVNVIEVKTLTYEKINELKKQAEEYQAKQIVELERELKEKQELIAKNERRLQHLSYVLAKEHFNELVETGETQTTKEFETMYVDFLNGGTFNEEIAPYEYKKILGRLQ